MEKNQGPYGSIRPISNLTFSFMLFSKIRFGKMAVPLVCHLRLSVKRLEEQIQECPALPTPTTGGAAGELEGWA